MNRFRTCTKNFALFCFLAVLAITKPAIAQADVEAPVLIRGNHIYADIDTSGQVVYLFFQEELWKYDLQNDEWKELVYEGKTEEPIESYQFGFNHKKNSLYVWANG